MKKEQKNIWNLNQGDPKKRFACHKCGKVGHFIRECPLNKPQQEISVIGRNGKPIPRCFHCKKLGHIENNCFIKFPEKKKTFQKRSVNVNGVDIMETIEEVPEEKNCNMFRCLRDLDDPVEVDGESQELPDSKEEETGSAVIPSPAGKRKSPKTKMTREEELEFLDEKIKQVNKIQKVESAHVCKAKLTISNAKNGMGRVYKVNASFDTCSSYTLMSYALARKMGLKIIPAKDIQSAHQLNRDKVYFDKGTYLYLRIGGIWRKLEAFLYDMPQPLLIGIYTHRDWGIVPNIKDEVIEF